VHAKSLSLPWLLYGAEFLGTALLVFVGLSVVILNFGQDSPLLQLWPNAGGRRLITGFLFGTTGALIALSPIGKESGAHINPVVTLSFWLMGKLGAGHALGYILAQFAGAAIGAIPLMVWGAMGRSVDFGATVPGATYGLGGAILGEMITTFVLIVGLFFFLRHRRLRVFTPAIFPFMYAIMVFLEADVSGTSTNPARSFGPALISGNWHGWWVYWLGPLLGALCGVAIFRKAGWHRSSILMAKLHHFEHDRYGVFRPGS
jgi:aquaporin Z